MAAKVGSFMNSAAAICPPIACVTAINRWACSLVQTPAELRAPGRVAKYLASGGTEYVRESSQWHEGENIDAAISLMQEMLFFEVDRDGVMWSNGDGIYLHASGYFRPPLENA